MRRFVGLWRDNRLLVSAFVLALAVMAFFAVRTLAFWVYWADPAHRNQAIEPWMTPRYIAHSWQVPPQVVGDALALGRGGPRITISELAEDRDVPVATLSDKVMSAILVDRAGRRADR